jgi:hypothetical protein
LRLAHLRISEIVAQSHYIYPSGQTLTINGKPYSTGAAALVVLIPRGTTYCKAEGATAIDRDYCGFAYVIEDRTPYVALLGSGATTNRVIVEYRVEELDWDPIKNVANAKKTPAEFLTTWTTATANPVADSVDPANTDLAGLANLEVSARQGTFDTEAEFDLGAAADKPKALISAVTSMIALERTINGKAVSVTRDNYVFSKAIPRNTLPNAPQ